MIINALCVLLAKPVTRVYAPTSSAIQNGCLTRVCVGTGDARARPRIANCHENVEVLNASGNEIMDFPLRLDKCFQITVLNLSNNVLSSVPDSVGSLATLQVLDVSHNYITEISSQLGSLPRLRELFLQNNGLRTLPGSLRNLKTLEVFDLSNNVLSDLPEAFTLPYTLQELHLEENQFNTVPSCLLTPMDAQKQGLCMLDTDGKMFHHRLKSFSADATMFSHFKPLGKHFISTDAVSLQCRADTQLAPILKIFPTASSLRITGTCHQLDADSIAHMQALCMLSLVDVQLKSLNESICQLSHLKHLHLDRNGLQVLPPGLGNLSTLVSLTLSGNTQLTAIPISLGRLPMLATITLPRHIHDTCFSRGASMEQVLQRLQQRLFVCPWSLMHHRNDTFGPRADTILLTTLLCALRRRQMLASAHGTPTQLTPTYLPYLPAEL